MKIKQSEHGFTLIEILVSISITAIIAAIIAGVFSLTVRSWNGGEKSANTDQRGRIIIEKLSKEIASIYPYRYRPAENELGKISLNKRLALVGTPNTLSFVSTIEHYMPEKIQTGLKSVSIILEENNSDTGGKTIFISEDILDPRDPFKIDRNIKEIFAEGIKELRFKYLITAAENEIKGITAGTEEEEWKEFFNAETDLAIADTTREKEKRVLRGIEVLLTLYPIDEEGEIDLNNETTYPPMTIPIKSKIEIRNQDEENQL